MIRMTVQEYDEHKKTMAVLSSILAITTVELASFMVKALHVMMKTEMMTEMEMIEIETEMIEMEMTETEMTEIETEHLTLTIDVRRHHDQDTMHDVQRHTLQMPVF